MTTDLSHAILLEDEDDGSVMGEPADDLQRAVDAGILYVCPFDDGTCPNGAHKGGPFLHYAEGKAWNDYAALLGLSPE